MGADADRLARRIVRERAVLAGHLLPLDPLRPLDPNDESVPMFVAVDVDLGMFQTSAGSERLLVAEGVREPASFMIYAPTWRRLYALPLDGEEVCVGDGDPEGEMAWAAVYRRGQLIAAHTEPG